jgi:hypothetical protein
MSNLDINSAKRGEWHVVTVPAGIRVTVYSLPNKRAAQAALDAISTRVLFPWGTDKDGLKASLDTFRELHGMPLTQTRRAGTRATSGAWTPRGRRRPRSSRPRRPTGTPSR